MLVQIQMLLLFAQVLVLKPQDALVVVLMNILAEQLLLGYIVASIALI